MAQESKSKSNKSTKTTNNPREDRVIEISEALGDDAKLNAKHINYISFGSDKNKTRKNSKACDRGTSSGPARYCSSHLRPIYTQDIVCDNNKTEWCVEGRHNKECCKFNNNSCRLCNIDSNNYIQLPMINIAEALREELGVYCSSKDPERYNRALQSFLTSHIISDYPGTKKENTILRIRRNGKIWMEYFIKLSAFSSLLKTSAPSGYKYKDRISIGSKIKIQNNMDRDLIFCMEKDASYNDPEKEQQRPVVNGVGFWNLLKEAKQDEIRNIIQLNIDQAINVCFGFLLKNDHNVEKIEVELECTRAGLGLNEKPITLWCWPSNNDDDNSNMTGSPTISTQSVSSDHLRSTSPMSGYLNYPSYPTIPQNSIPMPIMPIMPIMARIPPHLPQLPTPQRMNNTQYQAQIDYCYNNNYQQPQPPTTDNDNMSHPITHYGAYHGANYTDHRYSPYHNNNHSEINVMRFEAQEINPLETMQQDQIIEDIDVLTGNNFPYFPDNETLFDNHQYFDTATIL